MMFAAVGSECRGLHCQKLLIGRAGSGPRGFQSPVRVECRISPSARRSQSNGKLDTLTEGLADDGCPSGIVMSGCTKGLLNDPGDNNCWVNSTMQVLWHMDVFRKNFRLLSNHACAVVGRPNGQIFFLWHCLLELGTHVETYPYGVSF